MSICWEGMKYKLKIQSPTGKIVTLTYTSQESLEKAIEDYNGLVISFHKNN